MDKIAVFQGVAIVVLLAGSYIALFYSVVTPSQLKAGRAVLGHTQDSLAALLGLSRRQYLRYEQGETPIPTPIAIIIDIMLSGKVPPALQNSRR